MGTVRGTARYALAVAVIGAAAVAGCGAQHAGSGGGAAGSGSGAGAPASSAPPAASNCSATPSPSAHTVTLSGKDNGKVLCVRQGTTVAIYLQGTPGRRWSPIRPASAALQPVPNGRLMLKLGVTGGFFKAVHPGTTAVTSSLPSCAGSGTATTGPRCRMGTVFHVTFVISQ